MGFPGSHSPADAEGVRITPRKRCSDGLEMTRNLSCWFLWIGIRNELPEPLWKFFSKTLARPVTVEPTKSVALEQNDDIRHLSSTKSVPRHAHPFVVQQPVIYVVLGCARNSVGCFDHFKTPIGGTGSAEGRIPSF